MKLLSRISNITSDEYLRKSDYADIIPCHEPIMEPIEVASLMRKFVFSENSDFTPRIFTNDDWKTFVDMFMTAVKDEIQLTDTSLPTRATFRICGVFFKKNAEYITGDSAVIQFDEYDSIKNRFVSNTKDIDRIREVVTDYINGFITDSGMLSFINVRGYDIYIMAQDILYKPAHTESNIILYKFDTTNNN